MLHENQLSGIIFFHRMLFLVLLSFLLEALTPLYSMSQTLNWVRRSDMIIHRTKLAIAEAGGMIYATGGYYGLAGGGIRKSAEVFNPITNSWSLIADMPVKRILHGAEGINGKLYVVGGQYSFYRNADGLIKDWLTQCAAVSVYTPATNSWSQKSKMPTPRTGVVTAVLNDEIWVMGGTEDPNPGEDGSKKFSNKVEIYTPSTNSWRTGPPLPGPRVRHAATALDGRVYISGGTETTSTSSSSPWPESYTMYSSSGGGWTRLKNMPYRYRNHAMAGYQGKVYILGGSIYLTHAADSDIEVTDKVRVYNPSSDSYTTSQRMRIEKWYHDAVQASGTIYTIGGSKDFNETSAGNILDNTESGDVPTCGTLVDLNISLKGDGKGKVVSIPGINCGNDCEEKYCVNTPVTISAIPNSQSTFIGWQGDCAGKGSSCKLDMNEDKNVSAIFSLDSLPDKTNTGAYLLLLNN